MTEKEIQNSLYCLRANNRHRIIIPNCRIGYYEMDLLSLSSANLVYEHEIKISRADFLADFRQKPGKHYDLENKTNLWRLPNYFYFAMPKDLIPVEEIPAYAGLIYFNRGMCEVAKKAPKIHKEIASNKLLSDLACKLTFRYWNLRNNKN